jgi:hypothetical protein
MAQATQAERALPQVPNYPLAAVGAILAAILVATTLAFAAIDPFGLRGPSVESAVNPALRDAEARWELRHKLQSGDVDPLTQAQREWERQRRQQSAE